MNEIIYSGTNDYSNRCFYCAIPQIINALDRPPENFHSFWELHKWAQNFLWNMYARTRMMSASRQVLKPTDVPRALELQVQYIITCMLSFNQSICCICTGHFKINILFSSIGFFFFFLIFFPLASICFLPLQYLSGSRAPTLPVFLKARR